MNIDFFAFDSLHHLGERATHPLIRLVVPHKGTPIHYGLKPVWSRMRLPLSLLIALKDSDPLRAEAHVESYAPVTRPNAPSGASNCGF